MRLLVTRPEEDAVGVKRVLEAGGHTVVLEPLLTIEPVADAAVPEAAYQAVLATSANGVRALAGLPAFERLRDTPLLAVGGASAAAARDAGFGRVEDAAGDLRDLARLVREICDPGAGPLLYATGRAISGDLRGMLQACGYTVDRVVLYDAVQTPALSDATADALRRRELDGVLLYSPRTARIWARCASAEDLGDGARDITHFCLSAAVADALCEAFDRVPGDIRTADAPSQDRLLALIDA